LIFLPRQGTQVVDHGVGIVPENPARIFT